MASLIYEEMNSLHRKMRFRQRVPRPANVKRRQSEDWRRFSGDLDGEVAEGGRAFAVRSADHVSLCFEPLRCLRGDGGADGLALDCCCFAPVAGSL